MENYNSNTNSILLNNTSKDFISENVFKEEELIKKELLKKKITIIGLSTFYVLLLVVSFVLLN